MNEEKVYILPPAEQADEQGTPMPMPDCMSCTVNENVNESFECELTYPIYGENFAMLEIGARIQCKPNPYDGRYTFIIYRISKPINGIITVNAEHITYMIAETICRGGTEHSAGKEAQDIIGYLTDEITENPGIGIMGFFTDISGVESEFNYDKPTDGRQVITDAAAMFGGQWKFTDHSATLMRTRGQNRGFTVKYGHNAREMTFEEDISAKYTHICPFWIGSVTEEVPAPDIGAGQTVEMTYEKQIYLSEMYIPIYNSTGIFKPYLYDCSKVFAEAPTEEELRNEGTRFSIDPINANTLGKRTKSIEIDYVMLKRTSEYVNDSDYTHDMDHVEIGDTVTIENRYGETEKMVCLATQYNVLKDRYDKINVGYLQTASQPVEAKPKQPRTPKTIAKIERELKKIDREFKAINIPLRIEKVSDNEVRAEYATYTAVRTAQGEKYERHAFRREAYDKDGKAITDPGTYSVEAAAALMMSGGSTEVSVHPDELTYTDDDTDYIMPSGKYKEAGETIDTITEKYIIDKNKQRKFSENVIYYIGDLVVKDNKLYKCIKRHEYAPWNLTDFRLESEESEVVWGIGVLNKRTDTESVNRILYPDGSEIRLHNFNGEGGIG